MNDAVPCSDSIPTSLGKHDEPVLDTDLPIVDSHHHLWDHVSRYLFYEYLADMNSGHNVRASVFIQCDAMYRSDGDPEFAPVGETEFVNGIAAMSASGAYGPARVCAGIVGYADLQLGERVDAVLEAHLCAGGGRFRGVRGRSVWDADPSIKGSSRDFPPGTVARRKVPRRREPAREIRLQLRRVAVPPADPGTCRPCREVSRHNLYS